MAHNTFSANTNAFFIILAVKDLWPSPFGENEGKKSQKDDHANFVYGDLVTLPVLRQQFSWNLHAAGKMSAHRLHQ